MFNGDARHRRCRTTKKQTRQNSSSASWRMSCLNHKHFCYFFVSSNGFTERNNSSIVVAPFLTFSKPSLNMGSNPCFFFMLHICSDVGFLSINFSISESISIISKIAVLPLYPELEQFGHPFPL